MLLWLLRIGDRIDEGGLVKCEGDADADWNGGGRERDRERGRETEREREREREREKIGRASRRERVGVPV